MDEQVPEKDLVNVFRAVIRFVQSEEPLTLDWPDDFEGQARCIRGLSELATTPEYLYEYRVWAFDYLKEIAREYHKSGVPRSVPPEMVSWCLSVVSGAVERPKRRRGRPNRYNLSEQKRNLAIGASVNWLIARGMTRTKAVQLIGEALDLTDRGVDSILGKISLDEAKVKLPPESIMRILPDAQK